MRTLLSLCAVLCLACGGTPLVGVTSSLSVDPSFIDFGTLSPSARGTASITLVNESRAEVTLRELLLEGPDATRFKVDSRPLAPIAALSTATIVVSFTAPSTSSTSARGVLTIRSDAANAERLSVPLLGASGLRAGDGQLNEDPTVDAGQPVIDAGQPVIDAGQPVIDAGQPVIDAGQPVIDAGTVVVPPMLPVLDGGVPCGPGQRIMMTFNIPGPNMRWGGGDTSGGPGQCTGMVEFGMDLQSTFNSSWWEYLSTTSSNFVIHNTVANGRSVCTMPTNGVFTPHCATLIYASGRQMPTYCTIYALCSGGVAQTVGYSW